MTQLPEGSNNVSVDGVNPTCPRGSTPSRHGEGGQLSLVTLFILSGP